MTFYFIYSFIEYDCCASCVEGAYISSPRLSDNYMYQTVIIY